MDHEEENQKLKDIMLVKLAAWRKIADELEEKKKAGIAISSEDLEVYDSSSKAHIKATKEWEKHLFGR